MIKFFVVIFLALSLIPVAPYAYSYYVEWEADNPLDDDSNINLVLSSVTSKTVAALVKQSQEINGAVVIIDVRDEELYRRKHIKGAIFLHEIELKQKIEKMYPNKDQAIYLYSDNNDANASVSTRLLHNLGYSKVFYIEGGIKAWEKAGYLVEEYLY